MIEVEHWWEVPGRLFRLFDSFPAACRAEDCPEFLVKLDAEFWTAIERAGKITVSRENQEVLEKILVGYITGETSDFPAEVWGAGLTKVAQWSAVAKHARALISAIEDLPEYHAHELAESSGHSLPVATGLLHACAQTAEEQARLARLKRPERGRPRHDWTDDLVCSLAMLYQRAGGRVAASWSADQTTLAGPFPAFLRLIWQRLPSDIRPVSAEAFARRARRLPAFVRGGTETNRGSAKI